MKKLFFILTILLFASPIFAAGPYYVRTDGNNNCNGLYDTGGSSGNCAKRTIAAGYALASGGDTVYVRSGSYGESLTLNRSGSSGSVITLDGTSTAAATTKINITGQYNIVTGFDFPTNTGSNTPVVTFTGNHNTVSYSKIHNQDGCDWGKILIDDADYSTFTHNEVYDSANDDAIRLWGSYITISYNYIHDWTNNNGNCHVDFVQSFCLSGTCTAQYILIEHNLIQDVDMQGANVTNTNADPTRRDWIWRNNIFDNVSGILWANVPYTYIYNNMFNNVGYEQDDTAAISVRNYGSDGNACPGSEIRNNILIGNTDVITDNCPGGTPIQSNNYTSSTGPSGYFVNLPGSDFHPTSSATSVIDQGMDLSGSGWDGGFTDDYDGNTRTGTWDIGAYEYESAVPANAIQGVTIN